MMMNKKGIASSMIFIVSFFLLMAIVNLLSLVMWNGYNAVIQSQNESVISPEVKAKINAFSDKMNWADDLFAFSYFLMIITFLITAKTSNKAEPEFIIIFIGLLIVITVFCMIISNTWQFFSEQTALSSAVSSVPYTNFIMSYFPIITLIVSVLGALLFYGRKDDPGSFGGSGGVEGYLENDSFMQGGQGDNFE